MSIIADIIRYGFLLHTHTKTLALANNKLCLKGCCCLRYQFYSSEKAIMNVLIWVALSISACSIVQTLCAFLGSRA